VLAFGTIPRLGRRELLAVAVFAILILAFLPIVVHKAVWLGQGDVEVFFRAGWAIWTGYPLYQVFDHHGWTYHYPPTFALFMGLFANPLPDHPQPWWALPYPVAVAVWYLINVACLFVALHIWARAVEQARPIEAKSCYLQRPFALVVWPLLALLPFIGDGLARGQPTPVLLLLIVLFLSRYVEKRTATASFALSLAVTIKIFPVVLAIIPFVRRDWTFLLRTVGWCAFLLIALPVICVGPAETLDLYRAMFTEHLLGIVSGAMSREIRSRLARSRVSESAHLWPASPPVMPSTQRRCRNGRPTFSLCSTPRSWQRSSILAGAASGISAASPPMNILSSLPAPSSRRRCRS